MAQSEGQVVLNNDYLRLFAVKVAGRQLMVFRLLNKATVTVGDLICGDLDAVGGVSLFNKTRMAEIEAYIEQGDVSFPDALRMLGLKD